MRAKNKPACRLDTLEEVVEEIGRDYTGGIRIYGKQRIADGRLQLRLKLQDDEYIRINNSRRNDGLYKVGDICDLPDEVSGFRCEVFLQDFPDGLPEFAKEVDAYKNGRATVTEPWQEHFSDKLKYYRSL